MNCSAFMATATRFLQRLSSRASLAAAHASLGLGLIVCMVEVLSRFNLKVILKVCPL
jgi:hypothetical protein